jgi:hypothetical protein
MKDLSGNVEDKLRITCGLQCYKHVKGQTTEMGSALVEGTQGTATAYRGANARETAQGVKGQTGLNNLDVLCEMKY